jgi:hypothetical protein
MARTDDSLPHPPPAPVPHFVQRARQRLRLEITAEDQAAIIERIKADKPGVVFLGHGRFERTLWRVKYRRRYLVIVYAHVTDSIITTWRWKKKRSDVT